MVIADDIILGTTGIEEENEEISILSVNCSPNPCIDRTNFTFQLPNGAKYQINIFDVMGRRIRALNGIATGNLESVRWNLRNSKGKGVSAGVYLYRFENNPNNTTGKIIVK